VELLLVKMVTALVLPPGFVLLLGVLGLVLLRRRRVWGTGLLGASLALLWLLSAPAVGRVLLHGLETYPALDTRALAAAEAGAIVILAGGRERAAPEYGGETVSRMTLVRLRYGARLYRQTGFPVLVSGGRVFGGGRSEASLMRTALAEDFDVPVRWVEGESRNTAENARLSAKVLNESGVRRVILVTDAWHMPRAVSAFERAGLQVVAAPTRFHLRDPGKPFPLRWLPDADALLMSARALHEYVGRVWYVLRY
jgi:uncharacterized SAM-binding protein YcdF (DUF218 family)